MLRHTYIACLVSGILKEMWSGNWVHLNWKCTSVKITVIFGINRIQIGVKGHAKKLFNTFRSNTHRCKHDRDHGAGGRATGTVPLTVLTTEICKERSNKPKGNRRTKVQISTYVCMYVYIYIYIYIHTYILYILYIVYYTHTHTHTHIYIYGWNSVHEIWIFCCWMLVSVVTIGERMPDCCVEVNEVKFTEVP